MSVEVLALVLNHSKASGTAKVVLLGVANHDGDGGAWPSLATLATYANASVRQVQRALRELEKAGELITDIKGGGTRATNEHQRPNRYHVMVRCPACCDHSANHRCTERRAGRDCAVHGAHPQRGGGDVDVTGGGDVDVTGGGDVDVTRTVPLNHPLNHQGSAGVSDGLNAAASSARPRRRGREDENESKAIVTHFIGAYRERFGRDPDASIRAVPGLYVHECGLGAAKDTLDDLLDEAGPDIYADDIITALTA